MRLAGGGVEITVDKPEFVFALFSPNCSQLVLKIPSTGWARVQRAITKSHCWHYSYGLGASCISVWLDFASAIYLVQPRGVGAALWQLSPKMRTFGGKKPEKVLAPRRTGGCCCRGGQSWGPASPLKPSSAMNLFFTSWIKYS